MFINFSPSSAYDYQKKCEFTAFKVLKIMKVLKEL